MPPEAVPRGLTLGAFKPPFPPDVARQSFAEPRGAFFQRLGGVVRSAQTAPRTVVCPAVATFLDVVREHSVTIGC